MRNLSLKTVFLSLALSAGAFAQTVSSSTTINPGGGGSVSRPAGVDCSLITFEGLADVTSIGVVAGSPTVTFGASWLSLIDQDAGGSGNIANEPTPETVAIYLTDAEPIDFDAGVQFIEVFYSAAASSVPMTLTAWDGPGGTGNVVDTAVGNTVGTSYDGAPCAGDPNGDYCFWAVMQLVSGSNNIMSITLTGATANFFAFDNMTFCTDVPALGACCLDNGDCIDTTADNCASLIGDYSGDGVLCDTLPCESVVVPAVSEWGVLMLVLIGLVAGTLVFSAARKAEPAA